MTTDEVVASIYRHFMAGCDFLDAAQLREHKKSGICPECTARTKFRGAREMAGVS